MSEVVKNLMDNAVNDAVNEGTAFPGKRIKGPAEVLCERMHLAIVDELARGKDIAVEQIFEGMSPCQHLDDACSLSRWLRSTSGARSEPCHAWRQDWLAGRRYAHGHWQG